MLLYDRMLSEANRTDSRRETQSLIADLKIATVIVADNVARYYFESEQDYWDLEKDFPNLAPPFERFFIEYRSPRQMRVEGKTIDMEPFRVGILFGGWQGDTGWELSGIYFHEIGKTIYPGLGTFTMLVDRDGHIMKDSNNNAIKIFYDPQRLDRLFPEGYSNINIAGAIQMMINPALLAISFMHCKNVTLVQQKTSARIARKARRHRGIIPVRYYILDIEPMKQVLRTEGASNKTGIKNALHICRGHFKDYSQGRGLFGKYRGMYWWSDQVRGNPSEGIVVKDYHVKGKEDAR